MKLLYINACVRQVSRTKKLADYLVSKLDAEIEQINLIDCNLEPLTAEMIEYRDGLIKQGALNDEIFEFSRKFAAADLIVMAAPYWDMSFPSLLKLFVEHVNVIPLVFKYSAEGDILPQCKAQKLFYVTTKGGYGPDDYGYKYIEALSKNFYGIKENFLIKAEGLDIIGNDAKKILEKTRKEMDDLLASL